MEKFHQLKPGDCFIVDPLTFSTIDWDNNLFKTSIIQYIYYPKPWWKFWEKRKLKNVKIMFIGNTPVV